MIKLYFTLRLLLKKIKLLKTTLTLLCIFLYVMFHILIENNATNTTVIIFLKRSAVNIPSQNNWKSPGR